MKFSNFNKFLNKVLKSKATKLSLLGASTIALLLTSGYSYAKYHDEYKNNANAGIAGMGNGVVYYNYEMNQTPIGLDPTLDYGVHVFIAQFRIEFKQSEVARNFDLEFRMAKTPSTDYENYDKATQTSFFNQGNNSTFPTYITRIQNDVGTSYKVPNALNIPSSYDSSNTNRKKWDEVKNSGITTFEKNKIYFGYVKSESDIIKDGNNTVTDVNYTWTSLLYTDLKDPEDKDTLSSTNIDFINDGKIGNIYDCNLGLEPTTYYFSIIFFSEISSSMVTEDTKMLYKLTIAQEQ